jgi:hypothetical protein
VRWVWWTLPGVALIHIVEEYLGDWVGSVQQYIPGVTWTQFIVLNAAFLVLCVAGATVSVAHLTFALSVASLVLSNAAIHIVGTLFLGQYSPGILSSVLLYIPLGLYAFRVAAGSGQMSTGAYARAVLLGVLWMAAPLAFQVVRVAFYSSVR